MRILIDGPDLVGKTTVAQALYKFLKNKAHNIEYRKGQIVKFNLVQSFCRFFPATRYPKSSILNAVYIFSSLLDHTKRSEDSILICESYVDRAIAYGYALNLSKLPHLAIKNYKIFPAFDLAILLYSPLSHRIKRLENRENVNSIDYLTTENESVHSDLFNAFQLVFRRHQDIVEIDTSLTSVSDIVLQIAEKIKNYPIRKL